MKINIELTCMIVYIYIYIYIYVYQIENTMLSHRPSYASIFQTLICMLIKPFKIHDLICSHDWIRHSDRQTEYGTDRTMMILYIIFEKMNYEGVNWMKVMHYYITRGFFWMQYASIIYLTYFILYVTVKIIWCLPTIAIAVVNVLQ